MEIRILGPLEVWAAERIALGGLRPRSVLADLVVHANEVVATETLVDDLWGESPPPTAQKMIHNAISQLRRLVETAEGVNGTVELLTRSGGYMLRFDPGRLDAYRFERLVEEGRSSVHAGVAADAAERLREALALWRGAPFADLGEQEFLHAERARLADLRLAALEYRVEADLALGRHLNLIGELEGLVAAHPLTESFRAYLMLALYRSARQTDALRVYQDTRQLLVSELGLEPGPALQELERAILRHEPSLGAELPIPALASSRDAAAVRGHTRVGAAARAVRKTVTVLYADVEIGDRELDPEAREQVGHDWFERFARVVAVYGAEAHRSSSAGIVAAFGVPLLREDDAVRAARAATELHAAARAVEEELRQTWGLRFAVRIGLNTGQTVTSANNGGPEALAPDLAAASAELARLADRGETLLDDATAKHLRGAFGTEPLPAGRLRLVPLDEDAPERAEAAFVGREWELRQLRDAFSRATDDATSYLFTIFGTAGIGKSRLTREFTRSAARQATALSGQCLSYGEGITFWPVVQMVRQLDPIDPARGVADAVRGEVDSGAIVEAIGALIGAGDAATSQAEPTWAIRRLIEALARRRPLLLVFDDLQWAESTLLDLIEYLVEGIRGLPVFVLCLARPEFLEDRPSWGGGKLNATSLFLEPLSPRLSEKLVKEAGADGLPEGAAAWITTAAEGNPLFLEQLLAMVRADGVTPRELRAPPTIEALLAARLDRLDADERELLEAAAVVGREFSRRAVVALLPERSHDAMLDHADALVRRELIRPERSPIAGDYAFRFRHGLVHDAAYNSVPKQARSRLHERYADYLSDLPEQAPDLVEMIAHHLERAYRYRVEIAPLDEAAQRLGPRAAGRLADAGRAAYARGDVPAAASFLSRANELLGRRDSRRADVLIDLADALRDTGDYRRSYEVLDEVRAEAAGSGDRRLEAFAEVIRLRMRLFDDPGVAREAVVRAARDAIDELERAADDRGLAKAWELLAWPPWFACHVADAEEALSRSIEHARRAGDIRTEAQANHLLAGAAVFGPLPVEAAILRCEETLERFVGQPRVTASALRALAALNAMRGEFDDARAALARAGTILSELGLAVTAASLCETQGLVELLAGDPRAAEEILRAGRDSLERLGVATTASSVAALLARALYAQRRHDEALACVDLDARPPFARDVHALVVWRTARAKVLPLRGELDKAERFAREAVALLEGTDVLTVRGDALLDLAEVLVLAGRRIEARSVVADARALYERKGHVMGVAAADGTLASI